MRFHAIVVLLLVSALVPFADAQAPRSTGSGLVAPKPLIELVRARTVRVRVPAGLHSVTLEKCTSPRHGRWETVATKVTGSRASTIEFQLSQVVSRRFLRVKGTVAPAAGPGSLIGAKLFLADPALSGGGVFASGTTLQSTGLSALTLTADSSAASATRAVAESDIWRVDGDRLYFFNELRGLQVFDVTDPDDPALLGQLRAPGRGEQMYLVDSSHVALLVRGSSFVQLPVQSSLAVVSDDANLGAVVIVDVAQGSPREVARVGYRGWLRESRLVGSVLYVVSEVWTHNAGALEISSFDLSDPTQPVARDTVNVTGWGGVIHATDRFLFVVRYSADWRHSIVDVIDISSPTGSLARRGSLETAGIVEDKFKMHLEGDVFTAVSAVPRRFDGNGGWATPTDANAPRTKIETFSLADSAAPAALGSLEVGLGETVRATRFDDRRLYVVTFFQIDPLWVIDLTHPSTPTLLGELEIPGFSTYIEPLGDRLVAVGRLNNQAAVSLFDVSDPTQPIALSQIPLGDGSSWSEANWDEKAFNVVPEENLIVVPFSGYDSASGYSSRVQLLDLTRDGLVKRGVLDHGLTARRTAVKGDRLLAISSSDLVTVDFADRDHPRVTSEVEIAWRVDRVFLAGDYLLQLGGSTNGRSGHQQTLSVSTAADPESVLTTVALDDVAVLGAAVRDGRLYIAQRNPEWFSTLVYSPDVPASISPSANPFILSVFDLASLPAILRLARTESEVQLGYLAELDVVWPSPGVLVWVRRQQSGFYPFVGMPLLRFEPGISISGAQAGNLTLAGSLSGIPAPPAAATASSAARPVVREAGNSRAATAVSRAVRPPASSAGAIHAGSLVLSSSLTVLPWWDHASSGPEMLVFDVSTPTAPVLAATLNVRSGSNGDWSEAFAAAGKVYVSSMAYEDFVTIGEPSGTSVNAPSRRHRHFLKVVDLADPAHPTIGSDINIPGRLIGISNAGARLYTAGCRYESDATPMPARAVHASHFDGTAASFIDQVALGDYSGAFALDLDTVLIGVRGANGQRDRIQAWQLGANATFQRLSETETTDASSLAVKGGLLVAGGIRGSRELYDVTDAFNVRALGTHARSIQSWDASDLRKADGTPSRGLWEPLGAYGVDFVEFAP